MLSTEQQNRFLTNIRKEGRKVWEISDFRDGEVEVFGFFLGGGGFTQFSVGSCSPTFRGNISAPFSRINKFYLEMDKRYFKTHNSENLEKWLIKFVIFFPMWLTRGRFNKGTIIIKVASTRNGGWGRGGKR